jgi:hypothetical protein
VVIRGSKKTSERCQLLALSKNNSIIYKALISSILQRSNLKKLFLALKCEVRIAPN